MDAKKIVSVLLGIHGTYYFAIGIWALVSLEHFNRIVGHAHQGGTFEMHSIAAMAVALGIVFIIAAKNIESNRLVLLSASLVALSVAIVELVYLPSIGWNLFWLDLPEELAVSIIFGYYSLYPASD